jgi:hypothetical protein
MYLYIISVPCQKILNIFTRALEIDRKASLWRAFLACFAASANLFLDNLAFVLDLLILQDKHNIRTLSLNIKLICTRCETG